MKMDKNFYENTWKCDGNLWKFIMDVDKHGCKLAGKHENLMDDIF